jgi:hypothetical protein
MARPKPPPSRAPDLLREWRRADQPTHPRHVSQADAAAMFGISASALNRFERRKGNPGRIGAVRIATVTGGAVPVEAWS